MISYAVPGGGVGPHCDSYDVFLLQGRGHRRWRISAQRDLSLVAGAPLKLLARFQTQHEWQLGPGDMLYLPPSYAHDGVAMDECMTYSIGFRAPSWQELGGQFLAHLQDEIQLPGLYRDPGLRPAAQPARIGRDMLSQAQLHLGRIRWSPGDVLRFLGRYLTEPKPQVFFVRPQPALTPAVFARRATRNGVVLDLKTQMLYSAGFVFINGEEVSARGLLLRRLHRLADQRALRLTSDEPQGLARLLHGWYLAGYVAPGSGDA
jgi:50S ribosomal protein L16 3-hydroxylase